MAQISADVFMDSIHLLTLSKRKQFTPPAPITRPTPIRAFDARKKGRVRLEIRFADYLKHLQGLYQPVPMTPARAGPRHGTTASSGRPL